MKLTDDDPAFLLVDMHELVFDGRVKAAAAEIDLAAVRFREVATSNADDFVSVANEALGIFSAKVHELRSTLESLRSLSDSAHGSTAASPCPVPPKPAKGHWWALVVALAAGFASGVAVTLVTGM